MPKLEDQFGGRDAGNPKGDTFTSSMSEPSIRSRDSDQKLSTVSVPSLEEADTDELTGAQPPATATP